MLSRGKADLHMHSSLGDGLNSVEQILDWVEHKTDLDLISITDHDDVAASLVARDLVARGDYHFSVIPGQEVSTRNGHLLVYGTEERIPSSRSAAETASLVAEKGGWCIAPHPMSWLTLSLWGSHLKELMAAGVLLGVEMINPSPAGRVGRRKARVFNNTQLGVAETGGSDAHRRELIGSAYTAFEGHTEQDLLTSLRNLTTSAEGKFWTANEITSGALQITYRAWVILPAKRISRLVSKLASKRRTAR